MNILNRVTNFFSLIKFSHSIFALPFALIGFLLGVKNSAENLSIKQLALVVFCMIFARSAAMAFNRFLDKDFDKINPRTSMREIPKGMVKPKEAMLFTIISSALFICTTYYINRMCFILSPLALFTILFYSYTKRFTSWCHLILGLGLSYAPIGGYLCVNPNFNISVIVLAASVLFWVGGFDIIYSLQDENFDKQINLKSIPVKVGAKKAIKISWLLHSVSSVLLIVFGAIEHLNYMYWSGALVFISLIVYQHRLIKPHDISKANLSSLNLNGIASLIFCLFFIADILF